MALIFGIPGLELNLFLGVVGAGTDEDQVFRWVMVLAIVWVPLSVGMAARYQSRDEAKPEDYRGRI